MQKLKLQFKIKKFCSKSLPVSMVLLLILYSVLASGTIEYYILKRNFNAQLAKLIQTTKDPNQLVQILKQQVIPQKGHTLSVRWSDIGRQLLDSGVIDKEKYNKLFANDPFAQKHMKYLSMQSNDHMVINEQNARFMVNTLWALGLVNKSKILEEGSMKVYGKDDVMSFASTGGWTLGTKPTSQLYSSKEILSLNSDQQEMVKKIAQNIFRPCCDNSTEFPDCNHGMAALGYIELALSQGVPEKQIYKDLLALNSFWFPQQYIELAAFMNQQKIEWENVDPKSILSSQYSSSTGSQKTRQAIQNLPGISTQGGGCSS